MTVTVSCGSVGRCILPLTFEIFEEVVHSSEGCRGRTPTKKSNENAELENVIIDEDRRPVIEKRLSAPFLLGHDVPFFLGPGGLVMINSQCFVRYLQVHD